MGKVKIVDPRTSALCLTEIVLGLNRIKLEYVEGSLSIKPNKLSYMTGTTGSALLERSGGATVALHPEWLKFFGIDSTMVRSRQNDVTT